MEDSNLAHFFTQIINWALYSWIYTLIGLATFFVCLQYYLKDKKSKGLTYLFWGTAVSFFLPYVTDAFEFIWMLATKSRSWDSFDIIFRVLRIGARIVFILGLYLILEEYVRLRSERQEQEGF